MLFAFRAAAALLTFSTLSAPAAKPNVVVILGDDLSPEYLSTFGGPWAMPNLDRMAREGLRFDRAFIPAPACTPSRFALLTGAYPGRCAHPVFTNAFPANAPYSIEWNTFLDASVATLPRLLSANGYATGMAGKWHLGGRFDGLPPVPDGDYDDPAVQSALAARQKAINEAIARDGGFDKVYSAIPGNWEGIAVHGVPAHNIPWFTHGALRFIEESVKEGKPFFLYATPTAVHGPPHHHPLESDPAKTPEGRMPAVAAFAPDLKALHAEVKNLPSWKAHWRAGTAMLDDHIGRILTKLDQLGVGQNTLVIYLADHGVEPGKATCYERGTRVPMVVRWPAAIPTPGVRDGLVESTDIAATVLAAAGIPPAHGVARDGVDFRPMLANPDARPRARVYAEFHYSRAIRDENFAYIATRIPEAELAKVEAGKASVLSAAGARKGAHADLANPVYPGYFDQDQLYDLEADPYQQNNLARDPARAETLARLKAALAEHLKTFRHPFSLAPAPGMETPKFRALAAEMQKRDPDKLSEFMVSDHGGMRWPPPKP